MPIVKEIVHALDSGQAELDARCAREAGSADEVRAIGATRLRQSGLLEHSDIGGWLQRIVERAEAPSG